MVKLILLLFAFILNVGALSHSEDNILYFFPQAKRDGLNIIWAHDLNSQAKLTQALEGSAMMLEADVSLRNRGTPNQVPIMSPSSNTLSDITLEQWIDMVTRYTNKGIKLDFKDVQAVQPALDILLLKEAQLRVPLFFHADIIAGPNGQNSVDLIQPTEFIAIVNTMFPNATFSLGFVSEVSGLNPQDRYTWTMIFDMLDTSSTVTTHPITYNFRAMWANKSWQKFVWLLGLTNRFSVTIWSKATDPLNSMTGLEELRKNGDKRRIFYDLAPQHLARFKTDLSFVTPTTAAPKVWNRNLWEGNSNDVTGGYIYLSTEGAAIVGDSYPGYIQTIDMWKAAKDGSNPLIVKGQVQFVNRNMQKAPGPVSAEIIIRASPMTAEGSVIVPIRGIKCAIEDTGRIYVQDLMSHFNLLDKMITPADCYLFEILDNGQQVTFNVKVAQCSDSDIRPNVVTPVSIVYKNVTHIEIEDSLIQFTKSGDTKNIVLEDVSVQGKKFNIKRGNKPPNNLGNDNGPVILTTFLSVVSLILLKIFT